MEHDMGFKNGPAIIPSDPQGRIMEVVRQQQRYLWTACAATSLLSTRYLLLNAHLNFPVHLHFIHLIAISSYTFFAYSRRGTDSAEHTSSGRQRPWAFWICLAAVMALAVLCTLQAVLHLNNMTALIMTSIFACVFEELLSLKFTGSRRFQDYLPLIPIFLGACVILWGEYRLDVQGLLVAVPAIVFTGLWRAGYRQSPDILGMTDADAQRLNTAYCGVGWIITGIWFLFTPRPWYFVLERFPLTMTPLLALNVASTTVAIVLGKSILLPMLRSEHRIIFGHRIEARSRDTATLLAMVAIVGASSSLTIHRSYSTYIQFFAFFVALAFFGGNAVRETLQTGKYGLRSYQRVDSEPGHSLQDFESGRAHFSGEFAWPDESQEPRSRDGPQQNFRSLVGVAFVGLTLWMAFPMFNFQKHTIPALPKSKLLLDHDYTAPVTTEIVISMYKEPINDVLALINNLKNMPTLSKARVTIYNKNPSANIGIVKQDTGAHAVIPLPNVGREGETYLNHIINQWDNLAHETLFLQADVHNPREFYPRVRNYYMPGKTGMLNLAWSGNICDCHSCTDRWMFVDHTHLFPEFHDKIYGESKKCDEILLSYKGQFVVSAKRIRGVKKEVYEELRNAFVDEDSWAHKEPFLEGDYDALDQPKFGYYMERMWNMLFQCADTEVAWKCPTLLSGWRAGGSQADCQCFDEDDGQSIEGEEIGGRKGTDVPMTLKI